MEKERKLQKESIALSRKIEATWVLAMAQIALGYLEHRQGNLALAEELYEESLHYCRGTGEKWGMELILNNLGLLNYSREDFLTAKRNFLESLELARELGDEDGMTASITGLARIYQGEGRHITSARLQGVILTKSKEIGKPLPPVERETYDATTKALKESMGEQAYRNEFETGTTLTPAVPGDYYIDICRLKKNLEKDGLGSLSLMLEAIDGSTGNIFYDFDCETWMPLTIGEKDLLAIHEDWLKVDSVKKVLDRADDLLNHRPDVFRLFLGAYLKSLRRRKDGKG